MKEFLKAHLSEGQIHRLLAVLRRVRLFRARNDLIALAELYNTNKWGSHWYMRHYARFFTPLQHQRLRILEIGIGGEEDPAAGGSSLRVWKAFFRRSHIYGIDLYDKKALEENRISTFQGSQADPAFLDRVAREVGGFDIIIDDGSHLNEDVIVSFETLFPHLSSYGLYVVEDTQHSYWPGYGGSSDDLGSGSTIVGYFKQLADAINFEEVVRPGYEPTYVDRHTIGLHFFHNLIFIEKGPNDEGSNVLRSNATEREDVHTSWQLKVLRH